MPLGIPATSTDWELGRIHVQLEGRADPENQSVTPGSLRGPPFRKLNSIEHAAPWMPEPVRHDGEALI